MDPIVVARWRAFCLVTLGAFLGMSVVVYAVGLLPGDGTLHREVLEARGTLAHAIARWVNYAGKWHFLAPAMLLLLGMLLLAGAMITRQHRHATARHR